MRKPDVAVVIGHTWRQLKRDTEEALDHLGLRAGRLQWLSVLSPDEQGTKPELKAGRERVQAKLDGMKVRWVLALGNEGLSASTGHSGIMKWRGKTIKDGRRRIVATVSPAAVKRNPSYMAGWMADLRLFAGHVLGREVGVKTPTIHKVMDAETMDLLVHRLDRAQLMSYDVETVGNDEFRDDSAIVSLAFTLLSPEGKVSVFALPLFHPQSPLRKQWPLAVRKLGPLMAKVPKQVAHNAKFDTRWLRQHGAWVKPTFDTMLAAHMLDENRQKGLKPQAMSRLGVEPWALDTKTLLSTPLEDVLTYNALDTWYTYLIYKQIRKELLAQPRPARIYAQMTMPASEVLTEAERRGVYVHREKLSTNKAIAFAERDHVDEQLMKHVPTWLTDVGDPGYDPDSWPTNAKGRPLEVNFNRSNFALWWLFDWLELPSVRVSEKSGLPSMAEDVLMELRGEHEVVDLLLERVKWQKYCSAFFSAYEEVIDGNNRIHTTFKLAGTVTGRLSSGKADQEKISGKSQIRGVNLQQVPRDPLVRGVFGAPPGWWFVEADYSQIEVRIAALLSRDPTLIRLFQTGQDVHRATAAWILGKPADQITSEDRKKAKAVVFGFIYGMGWRKFIRTSFEKYGLVFSEEEARSIRQSFFRLYSGLQAWHAKQRRIVRQHGYVETPMGRIRHLPDIRSPDEGVQAEAERQAINSPVQGFGSDMCQYSMVLIDRKLTKMELECYTIGTVHDALLFEMRHDHAARGIRQVQRTMENLPLEKFGAEIDIPIEIEVKVGTAWGEGKEIPRDVLLDQDRLEIWLNLLREEVALDG